ncbi:MAG: 50S ribosomal protein L4 [Actinomycetota bacterium]
MPSCTVQNVKGSKAGSVDLDDATFGIEPNMAVLHQVVNAQLAARRQGTHSTKTRAEVRGGGAKPWKQKGTGRARAGSSRSPIWIGGGIAHGPKPRDYSQRTNKKMIKLATRSALSDRFADDKVIVVDEWGFDAPSTKAAKAALSALGIDGKALIVVDRSDANATLSFRNLPEAFVLAADQLNAYDILANDWIVFTTASLPGSAPAGAGSTAEGDAS